MELEMSKRLENVQYNVGCRHGQSNELLHYRKDLENLVKVIRNAYHNRCWDFQGIDLVTTSRSQVLGIHDANGQDLRNKGGSVGINVCSLNVNSILTYSVQLFYFPVAPPLETARRRIGTGTKSL